MVAMALASTSKSMVSTSKSASTSILTPKRIIHSKQAPPTTPVSTPSPGTWRHPKLDEINRRQRALQFDDRNVKTVIFSSIALITTFVTGSYLQSGLQTLSSLLSLPFPELLILYLLRLFIVLNIGLALRPLFLPKDEISDIPLTPSQRALLGLDPSSTPPPSPGTEFITPRRYRKSASRAGNGTPGAYRSTSTSFSSSPLSGKNSTPTPGSHMFIPSRSRGNSGSPFSPTASPLFQKAVGFGGLRDRDPNRRHSYGSSTAFGESVGLGSVSGFTLPGTPSPTMGKGPSVGLTKKWMYEKSVNSSGIGVY